MKAIEDGVRRLEGARRSTLRAGEDLASANQRLGMDIATLGDDLHTNAVRIRCIRDAAAIKYDDE